MNQQSNSLNVFKLGIIETEGFFFFSKLIDDLKLVDK